MYPILPGDLLTGGWEFFCCGFTAVAAVVGYLFTWR
jgi:hypothetical protein